MSSRKHPASLTRFNQLTDTFEMTVTALRDVIRKLPTDQQILLAGKVETIARTHQALIEEFACKPKS